MLGKKSGKKVKKKKCDRLMELLMLMDSTLETDDWEKLNQLMEEFNKELDLRLKGGFYPAEELKKIQNYLKHLEEKALRKKEELNKQRLEMRKLKSYGEF